MNIEMYGLARAAFDALQSQAPSRHPRELHAQFWGAWEKAAVDLIRAWNRLSLDERELVGPPDLPEGTR